MNKPFILWSHPRSASSQFLEIYAKDVNLKVNLEEPIKKGSERLEDLLNDKVSFIKIDCQGMDLLVLKGALKKKKKHRPTIVFEYEQRYSKEAFEEYKIFLESLDYSIKDIKERDFLCEYKFKI